MILFVDGGFSGGTVGFNRAQFSGGKVGFVAAEFSGGDVSFEDLPLEFSGIRIPGSVQFSGGTVDFSSPSDWSIPPKFPWTGSPPDGVILPKEEDQLRA